MIGNIAHKLKRDVDDLRDGKPLRLYDFDGREEETDLIYYGPKVNARSVAHLRAWAGAPLSVYVDNETGTALGLSTFLDFVKGLQDAKYERIKSLAAPAGGFDPRFAVTLDHRSNRTGCSHRETANTIAMLSDLISAGRHADFEGEFRSPGHVPLIMAAKGLLRTRRGHTELILRIGQIGGLLPIMVASEVLDAYTCDSMRKDRAMAYAEDHGIVYLSGEEISAYQDLEAAVA